jgi:hypothetical protein
MGIVIWKVNKDMFCYIIEHKDIQAKVSCHVETVVLMSRVKE